jgi:hypothetical protein
VSRIAAESLQRRALLLQQVEISQIGPVPVIAETQDLTHQGPSLRPSLTDGYAIGDSRAPRPRRAKLRIALAAAALIMAMLALVLAARSLWTSREGVAASATREGTESPPSASGPGASVSTAVSTSTGPMTIPGSWSHASEEPPVPSVARNAPPDNSADTASAHPPLPSAKRPTRGSGHIKDFLPDEL